MTGKEAVSEGSAASRIASGPKAGRGEVLGSRRFQGCFCVRVLLLIAGELADSLRLLFAVTLTVQIHASLLLIPYCSVLCARNSTCKAIQLVYIHDWTPNLAHLKITPFSRDVLKDLSSATFKELHMAKRKMS